MIAQAIVIILVIVMGMYIFGVGTDFLDDIVATVDEKIAKQNEVPSPKVSEVANFAKETKTRVCDLGITFYGTMTNFNPYEDPFNFLEDRFIWHGDIKPPLINFGEPIASGPLAKDTRIFQYQWYCTGPTITQAQEASAGRTNCEDPATCKEICGQVLGAFGIPTGEMTCTTASTLDIIGWNLKANTNNVEDQLSLLALRLSKTDKEIVRVHFVGKSLTNSGKVLFTPADGKGTEGNEFTKSITLPIGAAFPYSYRIEFILKDVTEDNYNIEFWDEQYKQNNKPTGYIFEKKLCKPGLSVC